MRICFATTNIRKFKELKGILNVELTQICEDIMELQGSMRQIVEHKLDQAVLFIGENEAVIVDDTGISMDALGGFPGVYAKDFLKIGFTKINEILDRMGNNRATVFCGLGIAHKKDGKVTKNMFVGELSGRIVEPRDAISTEFNDIFLPDGLDKCFSEMSIEEKNEISYRGIAGRKLLEYMVSTGMIKDFV